MNRNLKYITTILLIIIIYSSPFAQKQENSPLTLNEAIKLTVNNHPLIKQKEAELQAAQFKVEQQKSYYLPNVSAEASYNRIAPIPAFAFGGKIMELAPANNYNMGVFVRHTLYDFGKRESQVDYASSFLNSVKDNENLIKDDLSSQVIKVFYGMLFLEKSMAVKDTQLVTLKEHLRTNDLKIKNGTATDYDALSTKTRIIEINNEKIELQNEKDKQELFLKELIGLNREKEINIMGSFELPAYSLNSDSILNAAYNQRAELKLSEDARSTANLQKGMVSLTDKPVLNAAVGYGFKNGYEPNIQVLRGNWYAGVSINVPIFNGNLTDNKINETNASIDAADQKIKQVKESISTDVFQSVVDLKSNISRMNSTQEQIDYAGRSLERAVIQYKIGAGTNLEVLDSETALTQARLVNIQVKYKSIMSYYSLRRAVGDLRTLAGL
ncbi:MAG: TolC family protein [Bacteroidota bacterium]|nr:TolC family protein [Bacteroidota bacterium]